MFLLDHPLFDVLDVIPPKVASYTNQAFVNPPAICSEHMSMARDQCIPGDLAATSVANQQPPDTRLFGPYLRCFCYACDPATCP